MQDPDREPTDDELMAKFHGLVDLSRAREAARSAGGRKVTLERAR